MKPSVLVVIPARLKSTRLPSKPLIDLDGEPMIVRTYKRCAEVFPPDQILVATDAAEIVELCERYGISTIMTRSDHLTGTDRVAEVAARTGHDMIINIQGDEPLFAQEDLRTLYDYALANPDRIANGYCAIRDEDEHNSRSTPKVVFDQTGKLLYMSRSPIPGGKEARFKFGYRQVCGYAFPAAALRVFIDHPTKTPLEEAEDIEILRFLELGLEVTMLPMSDKSIPVDTPSDVEKVLAALAAA